MNKNYLNSLPIISNSYGELEKSSSYGVARVMEIEKYAFKGPKVLFELRRFLSRVLSYGEHMYQKFHNSLGPRLLTLSLLCSETPPVGSKPSYDATNPI